MKSGRNNLLAGFLAPLGVLTGGVNDRGDSTASVSVSSASQAVQVLGAPASAWTDAEEVQLRVGLGWHVELVATAGSESRVGDAAGTSESQAHDATLNPLCPLPRPAAVVRSQDAGAAEAPIDRREGASWGLRFAPRGGPFVVGATLTPQWSQAELDVGARVPLGDRVAVSGLVGYRMLPESEAAGLATGDAVLWGTAAEVRLGGDLSALGMVDGVVGVSGADSWTRWAGGLRLGRASWDVALLGGRGVGDAIGTPDWSVVATATYRLGLARAPAPATAAPAPVAAANDVAPDREDLRTEESVAVIEPPPELEPELEPVATDLDPEPAVGDPHRAPVVTVGPTAADGSREIRLGVAVYFDVARARVRSRFRPELDALAAFLRARQDIRLVRVEGYADATGTPEFNQELSRLRAERVVDYLVARGVARKRLEPVGRGVAHDDIDDDDRSVLFLIVK